ncbi:hypothetical protein D3C76_1159690 [compost metagenome]
MHKQLQRAALVALHSRARIVRRQFQNRQLSAEHVEPVGFLLGKLSFLLVRLLPYRIIFVLNAKRLQLLPAVQADELLDQYVNRNTVRYDMMRIEHQDVPVRRQFGKAYPQKWRLR